MEHLLSLLGLIVNSIEAFTSLSLASASAKKRKVGKELSMIIVNLDIVLNREEVIIQEIERIAADNISKSDFAKLTDVLTMQSKDIKKLAHSTIILGSSNNSSAALSNVSRVIHVFGSQAYNLSTVIDHKGMMIQQLIVLSEQMYSIKSDESLMVRRYQMSGKSNPEPDEYPELSTSKTAIENNIKEGWLRYDEFNLKKTNQRHKYLSELQEQLEELVKARNSIVGLLNKHFEIEDIL